MTVYKERSTYELNKTQQKAENSRNRIADVTKALVSERGYDAVTVNDIIKGSGVAKATFYHYFPSKNDLFTYIERTSYSDINTKIHELEGGTPLEQLRSYILAWFELMDQDSVHFTRQWFHHASTTDYVATYAAGDSKMDFDMRTIRSFLDDACRSGALREDAPVDALTNEIMFSMQGCAFYRCLTDGAFPVMDWVQSFCDMIFLQLLKDYRTPSSRE